MVPTSRPAACSERIAVSRPEPGPLTNTSTLRMPCSWARRAAFSAAICAANGVDLREPLKPTWPAEAHEITFPMGSVIDTIVLLNVLLMWAWPWAMFFFSLRRTFLTPPGEVRDLGGTWSLSAGGDHDSREVSGGPGRLRPPESLLLGLLLAGDGLLRSLAGARVGVRALA